MGLKDIQNEYRIVTGEDIVNSQNEPDIDYVLWLEMELLQARKLVKEYDSLPCVSASTVKLLTAALKDLLEEVDREGWNINGEDYQEQVNARKALKQVPKEYLR